MTENLETTLLLMVVGMGTVFTILLLVILSGKVLIRLSNKYLPDPVVSEIDKIRKSYQEFPQKTIAVLTTAVSISTLGKGKVTTIKKMK